MKKGYLIKLNTLHTVGCAWKLSQVIKSEEKKRPVRSGTRTHAHTCGLEHSLQGGSKVGAATTQSDRTCRQAGTRLSLCQSATLTEHRAEACKVVGKQVWQIVAALESSALTIQPSWQPLKMCVNFILIHVILFWQLVSSHYTGMFTTYGPQPWLALTLGVS